MQRSGQQQPAQKERRSEEGLTAVPGGQPIDKWFTGKFCQRGKEAYDFLEEEFLWLAQCQEAKTGRTEVALLRPNGNSRTIQAPAFAVNAHRVTGWDGRRYLCSEAPNSSSVYDFWELVSQEKVAAILMLNTPFEERLFPKSYHPAVETIQYWPCAKGEALSFAPFKIHCLDSELMVDPGVGLSPLQAASLSAADPRILYRRSILALQERNPVTSPPPRRVLHICFHRWPDGEVPLAPANRPDDLQAAGSAFVKLLRDELGPLNGPVLVHCHAGVGRTGVAVVLDIALRRLEARPFADVRDTLRYVRRQRPRAVLNLYQYVFLNLSLASAAVQMGLLGHQGIPPQELSVTWHRLAIELAAAKTPDDQNEIQNPNLHI